MTGQILKQISTSVLSIKFTYVHLPSKSFSSLRNLRVDMRPIFKPFVSGVVVALKFRMNYSSKVSRPWKFSSPLQVSASDHSCSMYFSNFVFIKPDAILPYLQTTYSVHILRNYYILNACKKHAMRLITQKHMKVILMIWHAYPHELWHMSFLHFITLYPFILILRRTTLPALESLATSASALLTKSSLFP